MRNHPQFTAYAALAAVCFFWGTTYLGIRVALETFSPVWLVAIRYLISGSLLLAVAAIRGAHIPRGREFWITARNGVITLGIGNGCLAFAEQWIPSGLAALIVTTSPFWMVGVEALIPGGDRLHRPSIFGMLVGFVGAALLVAPASFDYESNREFIAGFVTLQIGCAGWALGSIAQRRQKTSAHSIVSGAVQQLAVGLVYLIPALVIPQPSIQWSARGILAILYLITFGSIIGYSAYLYVLDRLPVALTSIHNYVNPVVAVALGWLFYREPFGWREVGAMGIIFVGVAMVKRSTPAPAEE